MAAENFVKVKREAPSITREQLILAQSIIHRWGKYNFDIVRKLFNGGQFGYEFCNEPTTKKEKEELGEEELLFVDDEQVMQEIQEICMSFIHKASLQMPEEVWDEFKQNGQKSTEINTN